MSRKTLSFISLALALLLLSLTLVACGDTGTGDTTTAPEAVTTSEADNPYDANGYLKDEIPSVNFNNIEINTLYWSDVENVEFFVEKSDGDLVEDAIFKRNANVQERLGVTLTFEGTVGNYSNQAAYLNAVRTAAAGGTNPYDMYAAYSMTLAGVAFNGYCQNLLDYNVIDLEKPWWPEKLVTESTINNKLYFVSGDLSTNMLYMMYVLYFNKDVITTYNLESPYDAVGADTWTYEKMFTLATDTATTAGGEGAAAADKFYGFVVSSTVHLDPFFYAAGMRTIDRDADGKPIISPSFGSERTGEVAAKVGEFLKNGSCTVSGGNDLFKNGQALFIMNRARYASEHLGDVEMHYGIVPIPKYDNTQSNYSTCLGFPNTLYGIATEAPHAEESAYVLECLSSEGHRTITPALFELSMKVKYADDKNAADMFDIIRSSVTLETGRIFTAQLNTITWRAFRDSVSNNSNFLVAYRAQAKTLQNLLDKLVEKFE